MPRTFRGRRFAMFCVVMLAGTGGLLCLQSGRPPLQAPPTVQQTSNGITAKMTIPAYPAKRLQPNAFIIELADAAGNPVSGYELSGSLSMPDMACGIVPFDLEETAPGTYSGSAVPLMTGTWEASVNAPAEANPAKALVSFTRKLSVEP